MLLRPTFRLLLPLHAPTYSNTGSTARDHLASERTFLAWLRTGLGFIALGIAVERFSQLDLQQLVKDLKSSPDRPFSSLGSKDKSVTEEIGKADNGNGHVRRDKENEQMLVGTLLGTGSGSIIYGTIRYFSNMRLLEMGGFKPAYWGAIAISTSVAGVAGAVYVSAVVRERERRMRGE